MKIFYSWQMDAPRKINKDFIHDVLDDAIAKLGEELDLSEAEREGIQLDQDTKGILGSPEISRVIFEKISASRVVVADVSLVAKGSAEKAHINSNVAIELGYAYGKIGDGSVIKVMNTHYGSPSELPFDLRIRRHPVQYELPPNADKERIADERKKLAGTLAGILRGYLIAKDIPGPTSHVETPFVGLRGQYWNPSEPLVPGGKSLREAGELYWYGTSILYFRCIPLITLPELTALEATRFATEIRPLVCDSGHSQARNKWGVISYDRSSLGESLLGTAQLFKNREIWGTDAIYSEAETHPNDDDEESIRYIPIGDVHRDYPRAINSFREAAQKLGYGDRYTIEFGFSGAEGVHLAINRRYSKSFPGPFYEREVFIRKTISRSYPTMQIMNDFWLKLFSEVGREVPSELVWTPE